MPHYNASQGQNMLRFRVTAPNGLRTQYGSDDDFYLPFNEDLTVFEGDLAKERFKIYPVNDQKPTTHPKFDTMSAARADFEGGTKRVTDPPK
jgi:hypothetical protein